jgi:hypothetical protein
MPPPRFLLGLDVEASGMGLRTNFLVQIGLSLVRVKGRTVEASFCSFVAQPPGTTWEERCVDEFWSKHPEKFERAKREVQRAPQPDAVAYALLQFVQVAVEFPEHTRLVVNTAAYDTAWLDWLLGNRSHLYLMQKDGKPYYADVLDVSSWYLGLGRECDPDASSKTTSLRAIGAHQEPTFVVEHDHDAANDATFIAMRAAWVMEAVEAGKAAPRTPHAEYGGVDPNQDPELALAMCASLAATGGA